MLYKPMHLFSGCIIEELLVQKEQTLWYKNGLFSKLQTFKADMLSIVFEITIQDIEKPDRIKLVENLISFKFVWSGHIVRPHIFPDTSEKMKNEIVKSPPPMDRELRAGTFDMFTSFNRNSNKVTEIKIVFPLYLFWAFVAWTNLSLLVLLLGYTNEILVFLLWMIIMLES